MTYDAVIIGAGHNGLTASCYLARAGWKVLVLERRDVVGGAAVTEELIPGFKISTASYSLSLLRPDVYSDLDLARHGLDFYPKQPQLFVPLEDGRHFFIWREAERTAAEIARISPSDSDGYERFGAFWEEAVAILRPFAESEDPPSLEEVEAELSRRGRQDIWRLAVAGSVADCVSKFFTSDELKGTFASQGIIGTMRSVYDEGTAWVMAYHFLGGELNGSTGTWGYVRGGMGGVTQALASAARDLGVEIRTGVEVKGIVTDSSGIGASVTGVETTDGVFDTRCVLSNAHPAITFGRLCDPESLPATFAEKLAGWQTQGSVVKVNLAMSELPDFLSVPGVVAGPQHTGTWELSPTLGYLDDAFQVAAKGEYPQRPFMEVFTQSASDDSLAPEGQHVVSAFTQYAPASVDRETWESMKPDVLAAVLSTMAIYAPNIPGAVIYSEVLGPHDLEERFSLVGGNIFHGEITPEQSFGERFSYRSPIDGLYLCGSGASPGGGVMAAAGRNAARVAIKDKAGTL